MKLLLTCSIYLQKPSTPATQSRSPPCPAIIGDHLSCRCSAHTEPSSQVQSNAGAVPSSIAQPSPPRCLLPRLQARPHLAVHRRCPCLRRASPLRQFCAHRFPAIHAVEAMLIPCRRCNLVFPRRRQLPLLFICSQSAARNHGPVHRLPVKPRPRASLSLPSDHAGVSSAISSAIAAPHEPSP